ncbi:hypothetical protein D3C81_06910 [compost metagenome]
MSFLNLLMAKKNKNVEDNNLKRRIMLFGYIRQGNKIIGYLLLDEINGEKIVIPKYKNNENYIALKQIGCRNIEFFGTDEDPTWNGQEKHGATRLPSYDENLNFVKHKTLTIAGILKGNFVVYDWLGARFVMTTEELVKAASACEGLTNGIIKGQIGGVQKIISRRKAFDKLG